MSQYTTNRLMTDGFSTIQTPAGTYPVAGSPSDVLTLTSSDGSIAIVGNAVTDTIDLTVVGGGGGSNAFGTITLPSGTSPVATIPSDTVTYQSTDNFLNITGPGSNTVNYTAGPYAIALAIIFG